MKKSLLLLYLLTFCLAVSLTAVSLSAAEQPKEKTGIYGNWKIAVDFDGRTMSNRMSVCTNPDGSPLVKWGLGSTGGKISDVNLADNKLKFLQTRKGRDGEDMETDIEAVLQTDGSLKGTMSSDFGEFDFTAKRTLPLPDVVGKWQFTSTRGDTTRTSVLSITQNDKGQLEGKWSFERGERPLSNVKFDKGILTFDRTMGSDANEPASTSTFKGEVKGNELKGEFTTDRGTRPTEGTRIGKDLIGEWNLKVVSDFGEQPAALLVEKDLSAAYSFFFGESDVNDIKLDADKLTFSVSFGFGDRSFKMDFSGNVTGNKLKGQFNSERGTSDVEGEKVAPKLVEPAKVEKKEADVKPAATKKD